MFCSNDVIFILKILKEEGIFRFKHDVPYFFLELIYNFLWEILYQAKLLSKYTKRKNITQLDIKLALLLKCKQNNRPNSINMSNHITNIINANIFPKRIKFAFLNIFA
nr:transcription initiation factor TFIID subunit 9 [Cryptomonas paramecium]